MTDSCKSRHLEIHHSSNSLVCQTSKLLLLLQNLCPTNSTVQLEETVYEVNALECPKEIEGYYWIRLLTICSPYSVG